MTGPDKNSSNELPSEKDPDLVIEGGLVITMEKGSEPISDATIQVTGNTITHISRAGEGPLHPPSHAERIDAGNCIVMPGLINAHAHSAMTLFRGVADDLPLRTWLFEKIFPLEAEHLNDESVYWGALLACLEMIASGTTCVVDSYFFQDATLRAVDHAGLRGLLSQGIIDFPAPGVQDPKDNVRAAQNFVQRWKGHSELITPAMFCHSPVTCSSRTLTQAFAACQDEDIPLQIHLSETREDVEEVLARRRMRPVFYLRDLGLLTEGLIAAHAVHLDDAELECLSQSRAKVVHVPESNMKLSSGVARVPEMLKLGVTVGIGTDGCASNNNLDLFEEMDTAAKLHKVFSEDPTSMNARECLEAATRSGSHVAGLDAHIGTLKEGKRADIIVVDLASPSLCPLHNPFSALVYSANGSDVRDVVVDGKILMRNRVFTGLDAEEITGRVRELSAAISA